METNYKVCEWWKQSQLPQCRYSSARPALVRAPAGYKILDKITGKCWVLFVFYLRWNYKMQAGVCQGVRVFMQNGNMWLNALISREQVWLPHSKNHRPGEWSREVTFSLAALGLASLSSPPETSLKREKSAEFCHQLLWWMGRGSPCRWSI